MNINSLIQYIKSKQKRLTDKYNCPDFNILYMSFEDILNTTIEERNELILALEEYQYAVNSKFPDKKHLDINIIDLLKYWNLDDITCCLNNYARAFRNEHSHYESTDGINIDDRWNKSEYKLPSSTITGISTDVYAGDIVIFNKYYPCKDLLSKEKIKILKDAISSMQEEYEDTELFRLFQEANKDKVWQFEPCDYIRFYIDKDNKEEFISDIIKFIRFYRYRFLISFLFLRDYNNFIAEFTHPVWDKKQNRYTYETIISEEVYIDFFEGHSIDSHSYITVPLSPEYPFNLSLHDDTLTCKLSNNYIRTPLKHIGLPVIYAEKLKCFEDKVAIHDSGKTVANTSVRPISEILDKSFCSDLFVSHDATMLLREIVQGKIKEECVGRAAKNNENWTWAHVRRAMVRCGFFGSLPEGKAQEWWGRQCHL